MEGEVSDSEARYSLAPSPAGVDLGTMMLLSQALLLMGRPHRLPTLLGCLLLAALLPGCAPYVAPGEEQLPAAGFSAFRDDQGLFACPEPCPLFQVVWTGDSMLGDHGKQTLAAKGFDYPLLKIKSLLAGAFAIGNAEGPITTHKKKFNKKQMWAYRSKPKVARVFAEAGFDAMGLANNHAMDRGVTGLKDTLRHLRKAGVQTFGSGMDRSEAERPLIIETPHGRLAVVGMFRTSVQGQESGPGRPGTAWLNKPTLKRLYARARAEGARWVVAFVHWGRNYQGVRRKQRRLAAEMARAGYDLVVGHGSHTPQSVDIVSGMPVLYSLGNFSFTTYGRFAKLEVQDLGYGLVARSYLGRNGLEGIELHCIKTDNAVVRYQPRPCTAEEADTAFAPLGPLLKRRGDVAVLSL